MKYILRTLSSWLNKLKLIFKILNLNESEKLITVDNSVLEYQALYLEDAVLDSCSADQ